MNKDFEYLVDITAYVLYKVTIPLSHGSWDSIVGIVTGYGLED
jgi:hypothetical protein